MIGIGIDMAPWSQKGLFEGSISIGFRVGSGIEVAS